MTADECLQDLALSLEALGDDAPLGPWLMRLRQHWSTLASALPQPYMELLQSLVDRLESSALFGGESCSFSQSGLVDLLQQWTRKARAHLVTHAA